MTHNQRYVPISATFLHCQNTRNKLLSTWYSVSIRPTFSLNNSSYATRNSQSVVLVIHSQLAS